MDDASAGRRALRALKILSILLVSGSFGVLYAYFVLGSALAGTSLVYFFAPPLVAFLGAFAATRWLGKEAFLGILAFYAPPGYLGMLLGITIFDWPYVLVNAVLCVISLLGVPLGLRVRCKHQQPPQSPSSD